VSALVVFGGGRLGAAVARQASLAGSRVIVASRTPRPHTGLWRRWEAGDPLRMPIAGARVCIALGPVGGADPGELWETQVPRLALAAWRAGAASVTVCGPAEGDDPGIVRFTRGLGQLSVAPQTTVLRYGPLFGVDDGCVWPLVSALRQKGVARLPRGIPPSWPLWVEDAARAVLRTWDSGAVRVLRGPERIGMEEVGAAITTRFGGRWVWRWWPGDRHLSRVRAWGELPEDWDEPRLGPRQPLATWAEKLPGLRRRR
jgi:uncharacterized protein YbjT (DUF2867 family)